MTTFTLDRATVAHVAGLPAVVQAARQGEELVSLWPLTVALQMDNDVKYAENLQVRITRTLAQVMTGEDVTVPDAEFVYEGADEIPGRPQNIVDALLEANDAYEDVSDYSDDADASLVTEAADAVEAGWSDAVKARVTDVLHGVDADVQGDDVASRFALALVAADALLSAATAESADEDAALRAALPVLLAVNEINERIALPRLMLGRDDLAALLARRAEAADPAAALDAVAEFVAPLAAAEWKKHLDDVLWDPDEAKKKAKEEDEKRNKEALAAKFAHVKDDPGKEHVEL
ncbi:hypothetical protein [Bifidobacterium moraviense]|nr:hypothetical protein [Bifidobacterium sp. DSM 109958]